MSKKLEIKNLKTKRDELQKQFEKVKRDAVHLERGYAAAVEQMKKLRAQYQLLTDLITNKK